MIHALALWAIPVVAFAGWRIHVWLYPFARCRYCRGRGWTRGSRSTAYGLCRHGPGRVRFGARAAAERQKARSR